MVGSAARVPAAERKLVERAARFMRQLGRLGRSEPPHQHACDASSARRDASCTAGGKDQLWQRCKGGLKVASTQRVRAVVKAWPLCISRPCF
eukprot:2055913-Pleurochrysis_carterae.AAC.1